MEEHLKNIPNNPFDSIDAYIKGLVHDNPNIMYDIAHRHADQHDIIELVAEIPEVPDPDLCIAQVTRWVEVSKYYKKPVRVYSYVYNEKSEKYIQQLTVPHSNIFITVIPGYLRQVTTLKGS